MKRGSGFILLLSCLLALTAATAATLHPATSIAAMPPEPDAAKVLEGIPGDFLAQLKSWRADDRSPMDEVERYIEQSARKRFGQDPDIETAWANPDCSAANTYDFQYECTMAPVRKALPLLRSAKGDARPYIILGIDRMLTHIEVGLAVVKRMPEEESDLKQLTAAGIQPDCTNDGCPYKYDLAKLLWKEQPETEAGQDALAALMLTYMGCRYYDKTVPDPFALTIDNGEAFLRKHPGNIHNLWVMFGTAEAYRLEAADLTRYDAQQTLKDTPNRKRAMELYLAVAQSAPGTAVGEAAKARYDAIVADTPFLVAEEDPCTWD